MGKFEASNPIYLQLAERISYQIVRKELLPGDKLLSVREMAISAGVNPNTVQRTYSELERKGIVETKRGQGTFVCEEEEKITQLKIELQTKVIEQFISQMKELGVPEKNMEEAIQAYLQNKRGEQG